MRLLYVADGRSPITQNWIGHFTDSGHEVHLVSTYPIKTDLCLASLEVIPVAFGHIAGRSERPAMRYRAGLSKISELRGLLREAVPVGLRTRFRQWFGPLSLPAAADKLKQVIDRIQPDLIHAMRIPYEGMLSALAEPSVPLLISVWGNDFTLHASSTPWMSKYTRLALERASALHTDCLRDLRLARSWGFTIEKPAVVLPSGGGIQPDLFYPRPAAWVAEAGKFTIINPRGYRAYVRNDTFFQAVPAVVQSAGEIQFLCPAMSGEKRAEHWVEKLKILNSVQLLPPQSRLQMADLFRKSQIAISPTTHDGTPNTLLEAMACGCFPIAGDIESIREWITPGVNGLLFDPGDHEALAEAILLAMDQPALRHKALKHNLRLIEERADHRQVMQSAEEFYERLIQ
jgi:glycosyltransferase involved in cell wall biosynthesis